MIDAAISKAKVAWPKMKGISMSLWNPLPPATPEQLQRRDTQGSSFWKGIIGGVLAGFILANVQINVQSTQQQNAITQAALALKVATDQPTQADFSTRYPAPLDASVPGR